MEKQKRLGKIVLSGLLALAMTINTRWRQGKKSSFEDKDRETEGWKKQEDNDQKQEKILQIHLQKQQKKGCHRI